MQWNVLDAGGRCWPGCPIRRGGVLRALFAPEDTAGAVATRDYGGPVVAAVEQGTVWATQFHPEKSAANGLRILANFVERCASGGT